MTPILEIHNLVVYRDHQKILDINELSVEKGRILAVVGPNGSGKSTLLMILARLLKYQNGDIHFDGRKWEEFSTTEYRRKVGFILQDSVLLNRTVYENISLGLQFRHTPKGQRDLVVKEWLELLGIAHLKDRPARKLSGGESRRVVIARAFTPSPTLLLMDEPFSALDRSSRTKLLEDLINVVPMKKTTIIFSTHSESDVHYLADQWIELDGGRIKGRGAKIS